MKWSALLSTSAETSVVEDLEDKERGFGENDPLRLLLIADQVLLIVLVIPLSAAGVDVS